MSVSHVCETSPAKAAIRQDITKTVKTFVEGLRKQGNTDTIQYLGLCGAKCTQEKEIKAAMPEESFSFKGHEINWDCLSAARKTGIMDEVSLGDIDWSPSLSHQSIIYFDYCCSPVSKIKDGTFLPLKQIQDLRDNANTDTLVFYTFSLRNRQMPTYDVHEEIFQSLSKGQKTHWNNIPLTDDEVDSKGNTIMMGNTLFNFFACQKGVTPVMYRVYHGGTGTAYGTPMMTIGLLVSSKTNTRKKYNFSYRHRKTFMVDSIECLTTKPTITKIIKEYNMANTEVRRKAAFSLAVRTLSDNGYTNAEIADALNATRNKVGAVMAWHKNRSSWD